MCTDGPQFHATCFRIVLNQTNIMANRTAGQYKALYPFAPQTKDDLELQSGDIIEVAVPSADDWGQGVCVRTGITGSFPWNYVEKIASDASAPPLIKRTTKPHSYENVSPAESAAGSSSKQLEAFPWYGGKMSRTQAEQHMTGKPDGTFLVRDSSSHQGYSLSVRFTEIRHVVIIKKGGKYGFSEPTTFPSLEALVKHFQQESLACYNAELETKLTYPYKTAPDEIKGAGENEEDGDEEDIYISNREALRHERECRAKAQHQLQFTDIYDQVKDVQENRKAQSVICAMLKEQKLKHESIYVSGSDMVAVKENYGLLKQRLFDAERDLEKLDNSLRRVEEENLRRRQSDASGLQSPHRKYLNGHGHTEVYIDASVDRPTSEMMLRDKDDGCYLFRKSERENDAHTLTMRYNGVTKHIRILYDGKRYGFAEPLAFYSLNDLCDYYKTTTLSNTIPQKLTYQVNGPNAMMP
eukprot:m.159327 g.159327  ORF g.159327 m.159327 type:complete len:468 (+) comp17999_c0_seq1:72-1475(+)